MPSDPNKTFAGYSALAIFAGICALPQIGLLGLATAAAAIYAGACFMDGYTDQPKRRKLK